MVERTYGAMTNDVLISIPLFVLMGYVMERGALVDKMFYSIQLAFRKVPASLAVATLIVCTFWGIASGLVGAVVVLMGVIAFNPMLKAGYDVKLASGVITAGGTLGILIPPSVMIIVYAAVAGQSIVKLYAAAMFPGFFLSFLYLVYIIGWAMVNPKIAPRSPEEQTKVYRCRRGCEVRARLSCNQSLISLLKARALAVEGNADRNAAGPPVSYWMLVTNLCHGPRAVYVGRRHAVTAWWYVVIHQQAAPRPPCRGAAIGHARLVSQRPTSAAELGPTLEFYLWFGIIALLCALWQVRYYWRLNADRLRNHEAADSRRSMPLGILTVVVLGVILFGITTATESAGVGAAGAFLLAMQARTLDWKRTKEAVFLTAKTTAMVCWLFVGSALFSGVFAILGGQALVEHWVLALNMSPITVHDPVAGDHLRARLAAGMDRDHRHLRADLPAAAEALQHRPVLWGTLVFVNLQAAFLSPPVAMSAFYLKGVAPKHVTLNQIFSRHDAVHDHRDHLHGHHVFLAGHDAVAAQLPLRKLKRGLLHWPAEIYRR